MAEVADGLNARHSLTGRQSYRLEVPGSPNAKGLSVVSFKAHERLGMPYRVTVRLMGGEARLGRHGYQSPMLPSR